MSELPLKFLRQDLSEEIDIAIAVLDTVQQKVKDELTLESIDLSRIEHTLLAVVKLAVTLRTIETLEHYDSSRD